MVRQKNVRCIKGSLFKKYSESRLILQRQIGESVGTLAKGTQFRKVRYFKGLLYRGSTVYTISFK